MTPRLRKFALTVHVAASVGWLGAVIGFLAHAVAGLTSQDNQTVRAAYLMMALTGWFVLVPLSFASLLTGWFNHWEQRGVCSGITGSLRNSR
jgi:hypothetical protein